MTNLRTLATVLVLVVAAYWLGTTQVAHVHAQAAPTGFALRMTKLDVPGKITPKIPAGWKFVGVSNGTARNENNMWFQDGEGNIYMMRGFTANCDPSFGAKCPVDFTMERDIAVLQIDK